MSRLDEARRGYENGRMEGTRKAHTRDAIRGEHREEHKEGGKYLRDFVYGALDGMVTTFAVVAGATGAALSPGIILILGFANLIGDGISMAMGNYLGKKSEQDFIRKERERESWEVENIPEGEREEVREIYRRKGFGPPLLEMVVRRITKDKELWVDTMMHDELGLTDDDTSAVRSALTTFAAFVAMGFIPLAAYVLAFAVPSLGQHLFAVAVASTAITIFLVGSARSLLIKKRWYVAGLEMLAVGGLAAAAAYGIGALLGGLA